MTQNYRWFFILEPRSISTFSKTDLHDLPFRILRDRHCGVGQDEARQVRHPFAPLIFCTFVLNRVSSKGFLAVELPWLTLPAQILDEMRERDGDH